MRRDLSSQKHILNSLSALFLLQPHPFGMASLTAFAVCPPTNPATAPPQKFLLLLRYNLFTGVDKNARKNITITVSLRVSVTVRVNLVFFVNSNTCGASSVVVVVVEFIQLCGHKTK